jgi:hypothetical protein
VSWPPFACTILCSSLISLEASLLLLLLTVRVSKACAACSFYVLCVSFTKADGVR